MIEFLNVVSVLVFTVLQAGVLLAIGWAVFRPRTVSPETARAWLIARQLPTDDRRPDQAQNQLTTRARWRRILALIGGAIEVALFNTLPLAGPLLLSAVGGFIHEMRRGRKETSQLNVKTATLLPRRTASYIRRRPLFAAYAALLLMGAMPMIFQTMLNSRIEGGGRAAQEAAGFALTNRPVLLIPIALFALVAVHVGLTAIVRRKQTASDPEAVELDDAFRADAALHLVRCGVAMVLILLAIQASAYLKSFEGPKYFLLHDLRVVAGTIMGVAGFSALIIWLSLGDFPVIVKRLTNRSKVELNA